MSEFRSRYRDAVYKCDDVTRCRGHDLTNSELMQFIVIPEDLTEDTIMMI